MLPVWLNETKINSLFLIKLMRVQMFSIMFGMKGSGRFGEGEKNCQVLFTLQIVVFISFTLFKKHFEKIKWLKNHSILLGNDQVKVNLPRPCNKLREVWKLSLRAVKKILIPVFWEISTLFSIAAVLVCIPTNSVRGFPFFHTLSSIYCL